MIITERYWRSKNGTRTKVEELRKKHLDNIINYLERKVEAVDKQMRNYNIGNKGEYEELEKTKSRFEKELKIMKREKNRRTKEFVQSTSESGKHKSSMSHPQRKMIAESLHHTFNYNPVNLMKMTDPKIYDVWKKETDKIEI